MLTCSQPYSAWHPLWVSEQLFQLHVTVIALMCNVRSCSYSLGTDFSAVKCAALSACSDNRPQRAELNSTELILSIYGEDFAVWRHRDKHSMQLQHKFTYSWCLSDSWLSCVHCCFSCCCDSFIHLFKINKMTKSIITVIVQIAL